MASDLLKHLSSVEELIEDFRQGRGVILVDDEDRENEGDIIFPAESITPEKVNFMCKEARGLICLSLTSEQTQRLKLPQMVPETCNLAANQTAFTVSIEAAEGVTTGISADDRAHTIKVASHPEAKPTDVIAPGHIFPIRAKDGGVLERNGHTEASIDLAKLAGLNPAAVICEVMNDDGSMARLPDLIQFAQKFDMKIGTIEKLQEYIRLQKEERVVKQAPTTERSLNL